MLSVHLFCPKWNIRIQQLFKTQFSNNWQNGWSQKAAAHLFSHFNNLTSPVKIIKAAAVWSFVFSFKIFFPSLFIQSLKNDGLQINNHKYIYTIKTQTIGCIPACIAVKCRSVPNTENKASVFKLDFGF